MRKREDIETMLNQPTTLTLDIQDQIAALLQVLIHTHNHVGSGAYETAWLARLNTYYTDQGFEAD